jgi:hypothetical protein
MYCDADYAGDKNTRRSTSGMIIMMNGGPISWNSKLQKLCALSTPEAEIYAMTIYEDNNACIQMGHGLRGSKATINLQICSQKLYQVLSLESLEANYYLKEFQSEDFELSKMDIFSENSG